jgi:hypothetical protein
LLTPVLMHSARVLSQSLSFVEHLATCDEHTAPAQPAAHVHVNAKTPSEHVEPFWHGDDRHSLLFVAQLKPL